MSVPSKRKRTVPKKSGEPEIVGPMLIKKDGYIRDVRGSSLQRELMRVLEITEAELDEHIKVTVAVNDSSPALMVIAPKTERGSFLLTTALKIAEQAKQLKE